MQLSKIAAERKSLFLVALVAIVVLLFVLAKNKFSQNSLVPKYFNQEQSWSMLENKGRQVWLKAPYTKLDWEKAVYFGPYIGLVDVEAVTGAPCDLPDQLCEGTTDERDATIVLFNQNNHVVATFRWRGNMHISSYCEKLGLHFQKKWTKQEPAICK